MSRPSAKVLADSVSLAGDRLTTVEIVMHRFVLAEFNTHRALSRNSASSRAIPVAKQIERVRNDPAIPVVFPREQKGMQGGDEIPLDELKPVIGAWLAARDQAVNLAESLAGYGVHKSVTNRLLEPFMWHTVIASGTDAGWANFFTQRCSPLAQPEMRAAAEAIKTAYDKSTPQLCVIGAWHLPYVDEGVWNTEDAKKISTARCARVSYLTHDGKRNIDADLELYDRLITADPPHASPLEHVATPCPQWYSHESGHLGNFVGWDQLRHAVFP